MLLGNNFFFEEQNNFIHSQMFSSAVKCSIWVVYFIEERCNCLKSFSSCELCLVDSYCHRTAEVFSPCDGAFKKCKVITNVQVWSSPQWCN